MQHFGFRFLSIVLDFAVVFKFTNLVCESYNKSWFEFHECRLKAVWRDRVLMNLNGTILHPAYNIQAKGQLFKRESGYKPWLYKAEIDCCRFLRKAYYMPAKIIYTLFQEFTNINHTCPYVGPQYLSKFYLKPELLLLPFPTGDYMLSLRWFFDHKLQFDTNISFVFVENMKRT
ncbi:uncharacterized protein LOC110185933 [Drosophila serrata]|uniref:uncharacterized protein LOC110185933 n=1 Tax=Drosophila serrata TaxID=7274 RepID=UPI000A1D2A21|nr:uncharacterized protein LOC110185933 [Drosophila serrata]